MRSRIYIAVMLAFVITAVFAMANQSSASATSDAISEIGETTTLHIVPDVLDQKGTAGEDLFVVGNAMNECQQLGYDYGFKQDDPFTGNGVGIGDGMLVDYEFDNGNQGTYLDWTSELGIDAVILKASTKANVYVYDGEANGDTGLRTPWRITRKGDVKYYGISHVTFCWDRELLVTKTATGTYDTDHDWSLSKEIAEDDENIFVGETANYAITVEYEGADYTNVNVAGKITLENPWSEASPATILTDEISVGTSTGGFLANVPVIASGGTYEITYAESITWANSDPVPSAGTNAANVAAAGTWGGNSVEVPVSSWTEIDVKDETVDITDSFDGGSTVTLGLVTADEGGTFYTTATPADTRTYENTACVVDNNPLNCDSATVNVHELSVAKSGLGKYQVQHDWSVDKSVPENGADVFVGEDAVYNVVVSHEGTVNANVTVTGAITVTNPSPEGTTISLTDPLLVNPTYSIAGFAIANPLNVAIGTGVTTIDYVDDRGYAGDNGDFTNVATVTNLTGNDSQVGSAVVGFTAGAEIDANVDVYDMFNGAATPGSFLGTATADGYSFPVVVSDLPVGSYTNLACLAETATNDDGDPRNNCDSATVNVHELSVAKTGSGKYQVQHDWSVDKSVPENGANVFVREDAVYDVVVSQEGTVNTNVAVSGTITVNNPSTEGTTISIADPSLVNPTFSIGGFAIADPSNVAIGTGDTIIDYVDDRGYGGDIADFTNVVTVTNNTGNDDQNSAAWVIFTAGDEIDATVDVYDMFNGATAPGTLLGTASEDGDSFPVVVPGLDAGSYTNVACLDESATNDAGDPDNNCDSATVNVHELSVSKTAETSLTRTTEWSIDKIAGDTEQSELPPVMVFGDVVCDTENGSCYEYVGGADKVGWDAARDAAELMEFQGVSGHLAVVDSSAENSFIMANVPAAILDGPNSFEGGAWIGAIDIKDPFGDVCFNFEWVTGDAWADVNWASGEPNLCANFGDQAVHYWHNNGTWNNDDVGQPKGYLVEYTGVVLPAAYAIGYTVTVTGTPVDSDWAVSGVITVSNPNLDHAAIVDVFDEGVQFASEVSVPAGGYIDVAYSLDREDGSDGTNTASATNTIGGDTVESDEVTFSFDDAEISYVDNDADVTDVVSVDEGTPVSSSLGTADASDDGAFSQTWNYSLTVGPFDCETTHAVNNTATVTALDTLTSASRSTVVNITTSDCGNNPEPPPPAPPTTPPTHDQQETAFMVGEQPFCTVDENGDGEPDYTRWGWTEYLEPGFEDSVFDIYAAAGKCDITKGYLVGSASVTNGTTDEFTATMTGNWIIDEMHVNVSSGLEVPLNNGGFNGNSAVVIAGDGKSATWTGDLDDMYLIVHFSVIYQDPSLPGGGA